MRCTPSLHIANCIPQLPASAMLFPTSSLVAILAAAAGASAQSASSSTASAAEISSTSVPDNNITSPAVTLPLKNAPSFSQPNSKTWCEWPLQASADGMQLRISFIHCGSQLPIAGFR